MAGGATSAYLPAPTHPAPPPHSSDGTVAATDDKNTLNITVSPRESINVRNGKMVGSRLDDRKMALPLCFRTAEYAHDRIPALEATASKAVAEGTYAFEDLLLLGACERCAADQTLSCRRLLARRTPFRSCRPAAGYPTPLRHRSSHPPRSPRPLRQIDRAVSAQQRKHTSSTRQR